MRHMNFKEASAKIRKAKASLNGIGKILTKLDSESKRASQHDGNGESDEQRRKALKALYKLNLEIADFDGVGVPLRAQSRKLLTAYTAAASVTNAETLVVSSSAKKSKADETAHIDKKRRTN